MTWITIPTLTTSSPKLLTTWRKSWHPPRLSTGSKPSRSKVTGLSEQAKASWFVHSRCGWGDAEPVFLLSPGCQENLGEAIRKVSASKSVQVDYLKTNLFALDISEKSKTSSDGNANLMELTKRSNTDEASK